MKTIGRGRKKPDEDGEESFIGRRIMETIGAAHRSESIFNHKYSIKTYSNDLALKEEEKNVLMRMMISILEKKMLSQPPLTSQPSPTGS